MTLDPSRVRRDIPLLATDDAPAYLDNACMTLKPRPVIDAILRYYEETPVCAGRAAYDLARELGSRMHDARADIARFFVAPSPDTIVFTKNTTESLNLIAHAFPFKKGDVVLTTDREHNSNFVIWHEAQKRAGITLEILETTDEGVLDLGGLESRLARGDVRLVAVGHASNLDGAIQPVGAIAALAHVHGARVLVDGAQAAGHFPVNVTALGVDYYAASSHKMMGPTGVGFLFIHPDAAHDLGNFIVGGDTVTEVTYKDVTYREIPARYEAGLQNYAGILGAGAAARYVSALDLEAVHEHEIALNRVMTRGLEEIEGVRILGPRRPEDRGGILAFTTDALGTHEIAILLDDLHNVQVRSGDHCVHAWFNAREVPGSVRASAYAYNTVADATRFVDGVGAILRAVR